MKTPGECKSLEELRHCIDSIDNDIIKLWAKRFAYVKEVARYKNKNIESVVALERYNAVLEKRREIATLHQLDPNIIEEMYRLMLNYFINEELKILKLK